MPTATHHHQALHAASQTVAANHPALLNPPPPWAQSPVFLTFAPCFVVFSLLAIRHRVNLHRRGEAFTAKKTKPAEMIGVLIVCGGLFYLRDKYPAIRLVLEWPDRFAYYHAHAMAMWLGFSAAVLLARMVSALFAALFLRGGGSRGGNAAGFGMAAGRHALLPNPPEGYGWFVPPASTRTRTITRRILHDEEE